MSLCSLWNLFPERSVCTCDLVFYTHRLINIYASKSVPTLKFWIGKKIKTPGLKLRYEKVTTQSLCVHLHTYMGVSLLPRTAT